MRIAMVSEHASPLAALGGVDAGGQNVHVAALALGAGRSAATRSPSTPAATTRTLPDRVPCRRGVVVEHARRRTAAADAEGRAAAVRAELAARLTAERGCATGPTSCTRTSG